MVGVRPSVRPISILTMTHQVAACDATSVHFGLTISWTVAFKNILNKIRMTRMGYFMD